MTAQICRRPKPKPRIYRVNFGGGVFSLKSPRDCLYVVTIYNGGLGPRRRTRQEDSTKLSGVSTTYELNGSRPSCPSHRKFLDSSRAEIVAILPHHAFGYLSLCILARIWGGTTIWLSIAITRHTQFSSLRPKIAHVVEILSSGSVLFLWQSVPRTF